MGCPMWIYKTFAFGIAGITMFLFAINDLPEINYLFIIGGMGFTSVFMVGGWRAIKEASASRENTGAEK